MYLLWHLLYKCQALWKIPAGAAGVGAQALQQRSADGKLEEQAFPKSPCRWADSFHQPRHRGLVGNVNHGLGTLTMTSVEDI